MQPSDPANSTARTSASQPRSIAKVHWLTLLLLIAVCAAVRLWSLASKPFWFDECFSAQMARIDWRSFLHLLWWREANMSLYYALLRAWMHLGQSPFLIRAFSVVIATATLPAIYWLARLLYDRRVALIAAGLFALNAFDVRYALFLFLATLSSGFLIAFLRKPEARYRRGYIAASSLAAYAHFYALLLVAAQWLVVQRIGVPTNRNDAAADSATKIKGELRGAWIAISFALLPLIAFIVKTGAGPIKWIHRPGLWDFLQFCEHMAGGNSWLLLAICAVACAGAVLPLGRRLLQRNPSWESWRVQFLLVWLLFPIALTILLSIARPLFYPRYMIFCIPPLVILFAAGLSRLRHASLLGIALAGIFFLCGQGILFVYGHDFDDERDAAGMATNFILDHSQPGDGAVFHIVQTRVPYEFFRALRTGNEANAANIGPEIVYPRHGPKLEYQDFRSKLSPDILHSAVVGHPRIWVVLMYNGPKFPDPSAELLRHYLPQTYPKMQNWEFPRVEVLLYSKE
jgi:mannosyltransferase